MLGLVSYVTVFRTQKWKDKLKSFAHFPTSLSGRPKRNSLSKRPGLLSAGSMESNLLVAPITTISPLLSNPSIRARRVDTMELQRKKEHIRNLFYCTVVTMMPNMDQIRYQSEITNSQASRFMDCKSSKAVKLHNLHLHNIICLFVTDGIIIRKKNNTIFCLNLSWHLHLRPFTKSYIMFHIIP